MPTNGANHSRLAALQPPIDWEDVVGEMLLSMPDVADAPTMADDASAPTPTTKADLDLDDLERFKRSLGFAPPAKFNSEGGLREPWADGMDWSHDRGLVTIDIDEWLREVGLDAATYPEPPWRDSSTRESSRIVTDSEATVRRRGRVEALTAAQGLLANPVAAFWRLGTAWCDSLTRGSSRIESDSEAPVSRRQRVEALTAALVVLTYAVAAFWWSNTGWQHQIESAVPRQNQPSLNEQAQSALTVLSPGVLQGPHNLTVEELSIFKGFMLIVPIFAAGGAVAALVVHGRDPRLHRRPRERSFPGMTLQSRQRCHRRNSYQGS